MENENIKQYNSSVEFKYLLEIVSVDGNKHYYIPYTSIVSWELKQTAFYLGGKLENGSKWHLDIWTNRNSYTAVGSFEFLQTVCDKLKNYIKETKIRRAKSNDKTA